MKNIFKKGLTITVSCLLAVNLWAEDVTFTMSSIFDGNNLTIDVTSPVDATVSTTTSKSNSKTGKLGSDGNYFQIVLASRTFSAASIFGFINTGTIEGKNWGFQFSTDGGSTWGEELLQPNDGNKTSHDIAVSVDIPANSNGFRVVRRAGTSTQVESITLSLDGGTPAVSSDATLSSLKYDGTDVPGFSASTTDYDVELPAGTTDAPTVSATPNDANADVQIMQASDLPGTALIMVTAENGDTKSYSVTFTIASSAPKVLDATWPNMKGKAVVDNVNYTITGQVKNGTGLNAIEPQFTGNNIVDWDPKGPQDFSNDAVEYVFSASNSETRTYMVTITEAPAVSDDATLSSLKYDGTDVPGFSPDIYVYNIELSNGIKTPPAITATTNNRSATVVITPAESVPGTGKVVVTAEDGETTLTYTINYTVSVPPSGLAIHEPEVYEAKEIAGGYNGTLSVVNGREYEVYYAGRYDNGGTKLTVHVDPVDKSHGITKNETSTSCEAQDGWFTATGTDKGTGFAASEEFTKSTTRCHVYSGSNSFEMHIKGYDQFSLYAADKKWNPSKPSDCKYFKVLIDNIDQPMTASTDQTIRRFDITTGEHLIKIIAEGDGSLFGGFSLRIAQEPRTKWLSGNDSTQVILQTTAPKPVYYFTKYNSMGETRLEWDGAEATGITLVTSATGALGDTLKLSGTANCPAGTYNYHVSALYNGVETSRVNGKITVKSEIKATTDTIIIVRQGSTMKEIKFNYYALNASDVNVTWTDQTPQGITWSGQNGKYIISGKPTVAGVYPFIICVAEGNCIHGQVTVKDADLGPNPVLFLCEKEINADKDVVYKYLKGKGVNLDPLEALSEPREAQEYAQYDWIMISENVDAENPEIQSIIRGDAASGKPVLNLNGFTYWTGRLGWGNTANGSVDTTLQHNNCKIFVQREDHPIFKDWKGKGESVEIIEFEKGKQGFMPIEVTSADLAQSLCLATAYTRGEEYYDTGELQTVLHEIPADKRGGAKYICLPLATNTTLNNSGKALIDKIVEYLLSPTPAGISAPELEIKQFSIDGEKGVYGMRDTIRVTFRDQEVDLSSMTPTFTLADPKYSFVTPALGEAVDFSISTFKPVDFVVSNYISRRVYHVIVQSKSSQDIEEVVSDAGQWVNIFDIYGRKVATTNENIYTMDLPRGMYIVVTENGETLKIMR